MKKRRWSAAGKLALVPLVLVVATWLAVRPPNFPTSLGETAPLSKSETGPTIELDRFSTRRERSADGNRLSVYMRLRTNADQGLPCFLFMVARNDHSTPKVWGIWPPQPPGPSVTASGHFHGATPTSGHPMTLSTSWQRITATFPDPVEGGPFDLIVVYIVGEGGGVLLSRPFRI